MRFLTLILVVASLASRLQAAGLEVLNNFQGIPFSENGRPVGMPLGGVGAGTIEITSAGTLAEFRNINNWAASIPSIPGSGLWVTVRQGGQTRVFPLSAGKVEFEGNFPFARLRFPDLPIGLTLWAWSPFIPHDLRHSAYPAAIFDAQITNPTDQPIEVGLVLSYGTNYSTWLKKLISPRDEHPAFRVTSTRTDDTGKLASGITFLTHVQADSPSSQPAAVKPRKQFEAAWLQAYDYTIVDPLSVCNRNYVDHPFGDGAAFEKQNFADLKPGEQTVYGVPFAIINEAENDHKSVMIAGPPSGQSSVRIPVGRKADCVFFLGNCAHASGSAGSSAEYVVHYAGGSQQRVPLRLGHELSDWTGETPADCPASVHGKTAEGKDYIINVYAVPVDGAKEIESIEMRQTGEIAPVLFAVTLGTKSKSPLTERLATMRRVDLDRMLGNAESLRVISNTEATYALAARPSDGAQVLTYATADPTALAKALEVGQSASAPAATVYAIEQRITLPAKASTTIGLLCTWHAPNHVDLNGHRFGHKYEEWFPNAAAVAEEIIREHDNLLTRTKQHFDLIATSTLPRWLREMTQSTFYTLPACTWLTQDGTALMYESPDGCPLFETMDGRYYGSFPMLAAFPELDATVLRQFAALQQPDGFIPHGLGGSSGLADTYRFPPTTSAAPVSPKKDRHEYDGYWVNLPIQFCLQVARHYQWTGNRAFLEEMWPHVKRAVAWVRAQDEDDDGLPETHYDYDGVMLSGKNIHDASLWNTLLVALTRIADDLGEKAFAAELRSIQHKARARIERVLWTGRYFRHSVQRGVGDNDLVSIFQTAGSWYADMLGFEDGVGKDKIRSALKAIDDINRPTAGIGLTTCVWPDGSHAEGLIPGAVDIGLNYFYVSACMYEGLDDIALRVSEQLWSKYTVEMCRRPWCQEGFFPDSSRPTCQDRLLRDTPNGAALLMTNSAGGIRMDAVQHTARIRPAEWIWKDGHFTLPVIFPAWFGQVKYAQDGDNEVYELSNLAEPVTIKAIWLRTRQKGFALVGSGSGSPVRTIVSPDHIIIVGPIDLGGETLKIRISPAR